MASDDIPPGESKQQFLLNKFFESISKFSYDKAKEITEKEKLSYKHSPQQNPIWVNLMTCLGNLALAEKTYSSLEFLSFNLGQRLLGRKDSLKTTFQAIATELKNIEDVYSKTQKATVAATAPGAGAHASLSRQWSVDWLLGHLCRQLAEYAQAKSKIIEFLLMMSSSSQFKSINYEELYTTISDIIEQYKKGFHHPILSPLKSCFTLECDVMSCLLRAQIELQHCQFLRSLLQLSEAHSKLTAWSATLSAKETKTSFFGGSRSPGLPALFHWLLRFKGVLLSKFTLYFYEVLAKQGPPAELKSHIGKNSTDFVSKIHQFQKKSDAFCVTLVFDTNGLSPGFQFTGLGYQTPGDKGSERSAGLESYPAIFTYPQGRAEKHWPMVICIMSDHESQLDSCEKVVCFQDPKIQSTYFLTRIERRLTFVVIFECKKSDRDSYVNNFIHDLCSHLRCTRLFGSLKPK